MTDEPKDETARVINVGQSAERFKAFCDAVIAIAMTLLILPLMESVSEASKEHLTTAEFIGEHVNQLISFGLSFALIATFWVLHHRLYDGVERITQALLLMNLVWLAAIVWLPVAAAMVGQMPGDPLQALLYGGTLVVASLMLAIMRVYLLRHPWLTEAKPQSIVFGLAVNIWLLVCFIVTMVATMLWPGNGNYGYFLCMLVGVLGRAIYPLLAPIFGVSPKIPTKEELRA